MPDGPSSVEAPSGLTSELPPGLAPDLRATSLPPLKILHVCPLPHFSGLEAYAFAVAHGQTKLGHRLQFATLTGSPLSEKCKSALIPVIEIKKNLTGILFFLWRVCALILSPLRPQIIHLHSTQDLDLMLLPLLLSRLLGRKRPRVVLQTHIWISHSKRDPLHAISYFLTDQIWCSSEPAQETLTRYLPVPVKKIHIMKYGRDIEAISKSFLSKSDARLELKLPVTSVVIGAVARIDRGKGTRELFEAAIELMESEPDFHLIWIGPPTAGDPLEATYAEALLRRIASLPPNKRERIHLPGAIPDSYRYLKAFDLFALPTYKECFSLALLEAQLAGLPVLGTDSGGTPEVVKDGSTGWLFKPESVSATREALKRALAERSKWVEFGKKAEARVRSEFNFQDILPQTIENYRTLLKGCDPF